MKTTQEFKEMIGKKVTCISVGMKVYGTVTEVTEDDHATHITVEHSDCPVRWGEHTYKAAHLFQRHCDGWGSAQHIKLV